MFHIGSLKHNMKISFLRHIIVHIHMCLLNDPPPPPTPKNNTYKLTHYLNIKKKKKQNIKFF